MAHGYCIAQHNCNLFFCNTVVSVWKPFLMLLSPCPFGPSPLWPALLLYSTFVTCDIDRARPAWNIICWPGPSVFFFDFYPSRLHPHSVLLPPVLAHVSRLRFSLFCNKAVRNLKVIWATPLSLAPVLLLSQPTMVYWLCLYPLLW